MQNDWSAAKLGDFIAHQKGFAFKSKDYTTSGYPVVRVSNFTDRSIDSSDLKYLPEELENQYSAYKLQTYDSVVATVGSWPTNPASVVGKTISVPRNLDGALLNQNAVLLRAKDELDQRFLFYLLKTNEYQNYIVSTAQGSANQASITLKAIFDFEFMRPSLKEQVAIAHILSTLDDKIELNRHMNKTLESMAQALFKSWFVDFDPVIDNALAAGNEIPEPLQKRATARQALGDQRKSLHVEVQSLFPDRFVFTDEMGWVPVGWKVETLGSLVAQRVERVQPSEYTRSVPYVPIDCISSNSLFLESSKDGDDAQSSLIKFCAGDILFGAMRPYFHKVCITPFDGTTRTTAFVLYPLNEMDFSFATLALHQTRTIEHATTHSTGTTIPYAKWDKSFSEMEIVVPSPELRKLFEDNAGDWLRKIPTKYDENNSLSNLRDTLLPQLLSGELRISDAEKQVAEAV